VEIKTIKGMKCAIFDLDGVICDTARYHYLAWKRLAGTLGFEFGERDNERLKGVSRMASLDILLEVGRKTVPEKEKAVLADRKNAWYVEYIERMDPSELLPGVVDYIRALRSRGISTALGSASKNAGMILDKLRVAELFDAVIDGTLVSKAKPDPEVFLKAAGAVNAAPADCVVFEDAEAGIEAAKRAGMYAVGIGKREILRKADMIIKGLIDLIQ
jgi:beta-phosphoglucomutase